MSRALVVALALTTTLTACGTAAPDKKSDDGPVPVLQVSPAEPRIIADPGPPYSYIYKVPKGKGAAGAMFYDMTRFLAGSCGLLFGDQRIVKDENETWATQISPKLSHVVVIEWAMENTSGEKKEPPLSTAFTVKMTVRHGKEADFYGPFVSNGVGETLADAETLAVARGFLRLVSVCRMGHQ